MVQLRPTIPVQQLTPTILIVIGVSVLWSLEVLEVWSSGLHTSRRRHERRQSKQHKHNLKVESGQELTLKFHSKKLHIQGLSSLEGVKFLHRFLRHQIESNHQTVSKSVNLIVNTDRIDTIRIETYR